MDPVRLALFGGVDAVLRCQQGLIRRDQALAAGFTEASIDSMVARRTWRKVLPRVYSAGADPADPRVRIRAGWLWAGDDAVVAQQAAALWHGLTDEPPGAVTIVVPSARRMSAQGGYPVVRADLHASDVVEVDRILVTSVARTCLGLARVQAKDHLETALRQRKLVQGQLDASLDLGRGTRGQQDARLARAAVADSPWSHPERFAHRLLREAGIRGWSGNAPVSVASGVRFPDIVFDGIRLILEIDGHAHHGTREAFDADRRRQNQLVEAGWTVLRFTAAQIAGDPAGFIRSVKATIARLLAIG